MKKLFILALLFSLNLNISYAALKVSPTIIELNTLGHKRNYITTSFNVRGGDSELIRFKVYPSYFEITEDGKMNEIPVSNSPNSLVDHAGIVPNEFTLKNGESQKVRITIGNIDKLPDGENRMVLFLEDVKPKEIILPYYKKDVVTKLMVKSRVGIPVYLDKGKFVKCASFDNLNLTKTPKELVAKIELSSIGNSKVRYNGKAQIIKGRKLISEKEISSNTIKNNGKLVVTESIPTNDLKELGEYKLRIVINYEDEKGNLKNITKETNFLFDGINKTQI